MVSKLMVLYLMYICLSNFPMVLLELSNFPLILELFFANQGPWEKKKNFGDFGTLIGTSVTLRVNDQYLTKIYKIILIILKKRL